MYIMIYMLFLNKLENVIQKRKETINEYIESLIRTRIESINRQLLVDVNDVIKLLEVK